MLNNKQLTARSEFLVSCNISAIECRSSGFHLVNSCLPGECHHGAAGVLFIQQHEDYTTRAENAHLHELVLFTVPTWNLYLALFNNVTRVLLLYTMLDKLIEHHHHTTL